jgi:hypothetical protein
MQLSELKRHTYDMGILGYEIDKRLESFAPYYSQSLLLVVDFREKPYSSMVLKIRTKKSEKTRVYAQTD